MYCLLVSKPNYIFVERLLKEVANQQILTEEDYEKLASSLKVYSNQKRIYFGSPEYHRICYALEVQPVDFKEDLLNSILLDLTLIDAGTGITEDTDGTAWIVMSQDQKIWEQVEKISIQEELEVNILDVTMLKKLMKQSNVDSNLMENLEKFNEKLIESRKQGNEEEEIKMENNELQEEELKNEILENNIIEINEQMEKQNENCKKESAKLLQINMDNNSRKQKEIFDQLEFIGKNETKITNKFYKFKNYKNYNIMIQSEFIGRNDIRNL